MSRAWPFVLAALACAPTLAEAQTQAQPPQPQPPADPPVSSVTVTAAPQAYKSSIDRKSYSLANDLQAASGSLADVLRNVPSVSVDAQGNVSLRGDPSVTILVDGKPSALFSDQSRADALQQISAGQFERVEVMTTPSAEFRPDGTGGIINLISKKTAPGVTKAPTANGSMHLNLGTDGRYNGGVSGAYAAQGLSLSGGVDFRHAVVGDDSTDAYRFPDPVTGAPTPAKEVVHGETQGNSGSVHGALDYDVDAQTRLSLSANHFEDRSHQSQMGAYASAAVSGPLDLDYGEDKFWHGHFSLNELTLGAVRKLPGADHELSVQLTLNQDHTFVSNGTTYAYQAPVQPNLFQDLSLALDDLKLNLKAEYKTPLPGGGKLTTGYELQVDHDQFGNLGVEGTSPLDAAAATGLDNVFRFDQQVHALYAVIERTFGKLTVQPGLRLEEAVIDTDQATTHQTNSQSSFDAYPTLHITYELDDNQTLKASYGRRVQRPGIGALNPFVMEQSPTSFAAGNPELKPEVTQSYELGWEFRRKTTDYQATLYYRDNSGLFTQVEQELAPAVVLTTQENLGHSRSAGIELVAARALTKTLSINVSTNVFWSQIDADNLDIAGTRSAVLWSGRLTLNWQVTKTDFLQLSASEGGKQLTAQGYREDLATVNLGWRHKVDDRLSWVATLQDPFDSYRLRTVTDTAALRDQQTYALHIRALFIGFTYALGAGGKRAPEAFDFGGPQGK